MFWTKLQSAMILKLFRDHGLNYEVSSTPRNLTGGQIWLMVLIQPHSGPNTPAPTAQLHVPPHCGQWSCAHHVWISELPWSPLTAHNSRAQSRSQRTIQVAQTQGTPQKENKRVRISMKKINQHKCLENISNKIIDENFPKLNKVPVSVK